MTPIKDYRIKPEQPKPEQYVILKMLVAGGAIGFIFGYGLLFV